MKSPNHSNDAPRVRIVTLLLVMTSLISLSLTGCKTNLVGDLLAPVRSTVNGILNDVTTSGNTLLVTAAGQLDLAVSNAESAFADDLNKSVDSVDVSVRQTIDRLKSYADQLNNSVHQDLNVIIDGSQQIVNSLPFTNKNPQVRAYTPVYRSPNSNDPLELTVSGNFFWAEESKTAVSLSINGDTIQPNLSTTTQVGFSIPAKYFTQSPHGFTPTSFALRAPYEKGIVFQSIEPGVFHLLVTTLPAQPLKQLTLKNSTTVTGTESRQEIQPAEYTTDGQGWRVESWSSCHDEQDSHTISADPGGWQIVPSSIEVKYAARGYAPRGSATVASASPTGFVVVGKTQSNCFAGISDHSGDITYYVEYSEQRASTSTSQETRDLLAAPNPAFGWGDRIIAPVTKGGWTLHAELWDGTALDFTGTSSQNPFLIVEDEGTSVGISLKAPTAIGQG